MVIGVVGLFKAGPHVWGHKLRRRPDNNRTGFVRDLGSSCIDTVFTHSHSVIRIVLLFLFLMRAVLVNSATTNDTRADRVIDETFLLGRQVGRTRNWQGRGQVTVRSGGDRDAAVCRSRVGATDATAAHSRLPLLIVAIGGGGGSGGDDV